VLRKKPEYADVIARNGTIAYEYTSLNPDKHVENTMAAVKALKR
jgi:peroxiredoxin